MDNSNKTRNFFVAKFPSLILNNEIVATILYIVKEKIVRLKNKVDNQLNTDI